MVGPQTSTTADEIASLGTLDEAINKLEKDLNNAVQIVQKSATSAEDSTNVADSLKMINQIKLLSLQNMIYNEAEYLAYKLLALDKSRFDGKNENEFIDIVKSELTLYLRNLEQTLTAEGIEPRFLLDTIKTVSNQLKGILSSVFDYRINGDENRMQIYGYRINEQPLQAPEKPDGGLYYPINKSDTQDIPFEIAFSYLKARLQKAAIQVDKNVDESLGIIEGIIDKLKPLSWKMDDKQAKLLVENVLKRRLPVELWDRTPEDQLKVYLIVLAHSLKVEEGNESEFLPKKNG